MAGGKTGMTRRDFVGYGTTADAYHITEPAPQGEGLAFKGPESP